METQVLGLNTYYDVYGQGEKTLLILHGWMNDVSTWKGIIKRLEPYFTIYAVDFPSHGGSAAIAKNSSLVSFVEFTRGFIKQMNIEGCDVLAHSFGGRVAIYLAAEDSRLFNRIVLTGAAGLVKTKTFKDKTRTFIYNVKKNTIKLLSFLPGVGKYFKESLNKLRHKYNSSDYMNLSDDLRQTFVNIIKKDLSAYLPKIKNQTLLIYGENDTATPLWMARRFQKEIPNTKLHIMPGDHYCFLKYPDPFCDYVLDFLLEDEL